MSWHSNHLRSQIFRCAHNGVSPKAGAHQRSWFNFSKAIWKQQVGSVTPLPIQMRFKKTQQFHQKPMEFPKQNGNSFVSFSLANIILHPHRAISVTFPRWLVGLSLGPAVDHLGQAELHHFHVARSAGENIFWLQILKIPGVPGGFVWKNPPKVRRSEPTFERIRLLAFPVSSGSFCTDANEFLMTNSDYRQPSGFSPKHRLKHPPVSFMYCGKNSASQKLNFPMNKHHCQKMLSSCTHQIPRRDCSMTKMKTCNASQIQGSNMSQVQEFLLLWTWNITPYLLAASDLLENCWCHILNDNIETGLGQLNVGHQDDLNGQKVMRLMANILHLECIVI